MENIPMTISNTQNPRAEASALANALDGLSAGVFLVDRHCHIEHANEAARRMLDEDDFIRSVADQLVMRDATANNNLHEAIRGDGDLGMAAGKATVVLIARDGQRYIAHLWPLRSLNCDGPEVPKAAAALFVRKVEPDSQSYGGVVASAFGLTPAELRVLLAIVEVGGVPETSEMLGLAETTVKTHLYRVFSKTGACRQADLVKLASGFSRP
jgi:DNA-binding CsgD family transcriptional regulator